MVNLPKESDIALAKFIKDNALVDAEQYNFALNMQNKTGKGIVNIFFEKSLINERDIELALSKKFNLKKENFPKDLIDNRPLKDKINNKFIKQHRIIPFKDSNNSVSILISDPFGISNIMKLKALVGKNIDSYICSLSTMDEFLSSLDKEANNTDILAPKEAFMRALAESENKVSTIEENNKSQKIKAGSNVIDYVDEVITKAIEMGVSDIHIEIYHEDARIRYRKDGVLKEMGDFKDFLLENYSAVITRIKILSSLDISERRLPQDGGIAFFLEDGEEVDLRVSILPTADGERVVMRIMSGETMSLDLDQLGFSENNFKILDKSIKAPQGMILVTGPTGSGKSTTLYAVLNALNEDDVNILTAEDPVEFNVNGIGQVQVKEKIGLTFSAALRSFLRQDPEVIMVGEIRDKETGDIAVKAALTGHLVLSTLHTNDAPSTVTRLLNMGIPGYLVTSSLAIVIAQRLARVNCPDCRVEDNVSPEKLKAFGFSDEEAENMKVYKSTGCESCMNTGIKGRRAVHEILEMTDAVKEEVLKGSSDIKIKEVASLDGYVSMQEVGRELIRQGIITVNEYQRILVLD